MYGATETQGVTVVHWLTERVGPDRPAAARHHAEAGAERQKFEVRVKGPTVTPGYLNRPDLTKGVRRGRLLQPRRRREIRGRERSRKGLVFDGRVTEDFKLDSGTWVSVGTLRRASRRRGIAALQDCVVCGQDKPFVGAARVAEHCGGERDQRAIHPLSGPEAFVPPRRFATSCNSSSLRTTSESGGSSARIKRVILMTEPPSVDGHEITDKGYVNQRATMDRRHAGWWMSFYANPTSRGCDRDCMNVQCNEDGVRLPDNFRLAVVVLILVSHEFFALT